MALVRAALLVMASFTAGCAGHPPAAAPAAAVEERPEPLPAGVKPLTLEQDEVLGCAERNAAGERQACPAS